MQDDAAQRLRFNPRAHEGRDGGAEALDTLTCCFNPRAHEGRDGQREAERKEETEFQSTRPRGARRDGD